MCLVFKLATNLLIKLWEENESTMSIVKRSWSQSDPLASVCTREEPEWETNEELRSQSLCWFLIHISSFLKIARIQDRLDPVEEKLCWRCRGTCLLCSMYASVLLPQLYTGFANFKISHLIRTSVEEPKPAPCQNASDPLLNHRDCKLGCGGRPPLAQLPCWVSFHAAFTEAWCFHVQQQGVSSNV